MRTKNVDEIDTYIPKEKSLLDPPAPSESLIHQDVLPQRVAGAGVAVTNPLDLLPKFEVHRDQRIGSDVEKFP